jgi:hypothetical protein
MRQPVTDINGRLVWWRSSDKPKDDLTRFVGTARWRREAGATAAGSVALSRPSEIFGGILLLKVQCLSLVQPVAVSGPYG